MNFLVILYSTFVVAVSAASDLTSLISEVPKCSLQCLLTGFESSPGAIIDPPSTCTNVTLQAQLSQCVQISCNYTEQAQLGILNAQLCVGKPIESRKTELYVTAYVLCMLCFVTILLRCYYRYSIARSIGYDDWLILATGTVLAGELTCTVSNLHNGFGTHYWNIDPLKVTELLTIFYIGELLYIVILMLTKLSILFFYLRVFPKPTFRIVTWGMIAFVISTGLIFEFLVAFQCHPVSGVFDRSIDSKCLNVNLVAFTSGGFSIGQDIAILILPIPELWRLNMTLRKKLNLLFMFSIGGLACITSIVRLKFIVAFGNSTDPTWDNITPTIWSLNEINVGIFCACLPTMRALFSRWLPALFELGNSHYAETPDASAVKYSQRFKPFSTFIKSSNSYNKQTDTGSSMTTSDEEMRVIFEANTAQKYKGQICEYGVKQVYESPRSDGNLPTATGDLDDDLEMNKRTESVELRGIGNKSHPDRGDFLDSDSGESTHAPEEISSKAERMVEMNRAGDGKAQSTDAPKENSSKAERVMGMNQAGDGEAQRSKPFKHSRLNSHVGTQLREEYY